MLETLAPSVLVLLQVLGRRDSDLWPSGSLAREPFEERAYGVEDSSLDIPPLSRRPWGEFWEEEAQDPKVPPVPPAPGATPPGDPAPPTPHGSFGGFIERHGSSDAWRDYVWAEYLTEPAVLLPVGLAISAAAISPWDKRLERHWRGLLGGRQRLGNIGAYTLLGTSLAVGVVLPGEGRNSWDEFWTMTEAYGASFLTTETLKTGFSRARPGYGTHSFPSGHASTAFAGATLIDLNSGPALGIPAYALATFTGFERVEAGRHFPSDVLAGAAIGTLSAGILDALHWGNGKGGVARALSCKIDMEGLRGGLLEVAFGF